MSHNTNTLFWVITGAVVVLAVSLVTYLTCRKELKENPAETLRVRSTKNKAK